MQITDEMFGAAWRAFAPHQYGTNSYKQQGIRAALEAALSQAEPAALAEPESVAWEATTLVYKQFITDEQYQKFSPEVQNWYKPYRCSACASRALEQGGSGK